MKRLPISCAIALGIVAWGGQAMAEATTASANPALPDAGFSVLRVLGALGLVLGLFFGGVWLFKNWQSMLARKGKVAKLTVLEIRSLGNRHALYVVGYERLRLLLAASPTGVNLVSTLPEAGVEASVAPRPSSFPEALQKVLNRAS